MKETDIHYKTILRFAKSNGYLSPIWLMSHSDAQTVQNAFQELEGFLRRAYLDGKFRDSSLTEIENFIWLLKKKYAFHGWDGIAPYLLSSVTTRKIVIPELNL